MMVAPADLHGGNVMAEREGERAGLRGMSRGISQIIVSAFHRSRDISLSFRRFDSTAARDGNNLGRGMA